jgi:hypothetical protein
MKKIFMLSVVFLFIATSSFASGTLTIGTFADEGKTLHGADAATADADSPSIGKLSSGVALSMTTNANGYALATQHKNGSKAYASSYDSTSIYSKDATTVGTKILEITKTDSSEFAAWNRM